jgi:hypothetical protein
MKFLLLLLISTVVLFGSQYEGSTTSAVVLVGGVIKSTHIEPSDQKYKRKNCPVCKGTGKYLSGDGIKMVDCGYCEPEKTKGDIEITHPPTIIYQDKAPKCKSPNCKTGNR